MNTRVLKLESNCRKLILLKGLIKKQQHRFCTRHYSRDMKSNAHMDVFYHGIIWVCYTENSLLLHDFKRGIINLIWPRATFYFCTALSLSWPDVCTYLLILWPIKEFDFFCFRLTIIKYHVVAESSHIWNKRLVLIWLFKCHCNKNTPVSEGVHWT